MDKRELARLLGVSGATVDRLVRANRIPFVPVGDVKRFDIAAVRAALETRDAEPSSDRPALPTSTADVGGVRRLSRPRAGRAGR